MSKKFDEVFEAVFRNIRLSVYEPEAVRQPFEHLQNVMRGHASRRAEIDADRKLTHEGKRAASDAQRAETRAAIESWHQTRAKGLDADLTQQRADLFGLVKTPDPARVDRMATLLLKHAPQDVAVFYGSATDDERREMEMASASIGRVPIVTPNGKVWQPLLDPSVVAESQLARAEQTNPAAAQKVRELIEIRAMQDTLTGVALSDL